jgi:hypothetical protein
MRKRRARLWLPVGAAARTRRQQRAATSDRINSSRGRAFTGPGVTGRRRFAEAVEMHQKELRRRVGEDCALMMALAGALLAPASPDCPCPRTIPATCRRALGRVPGVKPVLPDHGVPFRLVHYDDVAVALVAGVLGRGGPGVYNLAGPARSDCPTSPKSWTGTQSRFPSARST